MRLFLNSKTAMIITYEQKNLGNTIKIWFVFAILIINGFLLHLQLTYWCSTLRPLAINRKCQIAWWIVKKLKHYKTIYVLYFFLSMLFLYFIMYNTLKLQIRQTYLYKLLFGVLFTKEEKNAFYYNHSIIYLIADKHNYVHWLY